MFNSYNYNIFLIKNSKSYQICNLNFYKQFILNKYYKK